MTTFQSLAHVVGVIAAVFVAAAVVVEAAVAVDNAATAVAADLNNIHAVVIGALLIFLQLILHFALLLL